MNTPVGTNKRIKIAITLSPEFAAKTAGMTDGRLNNRSQIIDESLKIYFHVLNYLKEKDINMTPMEYIEKLT